LISTPLRKTALLQKPYGSVSFSRVMLIHSLSAHGQESRGVLGFSQGATATFQYHVMEQGGQHEVTA
jgi:hypothetical protein